MYDTEEELEELYYAVSNKGRWGDDDQIGTLNYITEEKRQKAAQLVKLGQTISISYPVDTVYSAGRNPIPAALYPLYTQPNPMFVMEYVGMPTHSGSSTHLDSVTHCNCEGIFYNGRKTEDILAPTGATWGGIENQRHGIFTKGVLLDICAVRGVEHLAVDEMIRVADLEAAEELAGVQVESGDCIFVRAGLELREKAGETVDFMQAMPGIHPEVLLWLHKREVAVWSGDCYDPVPFFSKRFPLLLHSIGLASMGLINLDIPDVEILRETCHKLNRYEFLLIAAPLYLVGASGAPVNPVCVF